MRVRVRLLCPPARRLPRTCDFGIADRALGRVVDHARPARDPGADRGARDHDAVVVVDLDPVVVVDADRLGVLVVHPAGLDAARKRQHPLVVAVGRVDVPLAVRREVVEHEAFAVPAGLLTMSPV